MPGTAGNWHHPSICPAEVESAASGLLPGIVFHIQYGRSSCLVADLTASPSPGSIPSPGSASSIPGHTTHSTRIRTYDYPSSAGRRRQPANSVGSSGLTPTKMVKSLSLEAANAASSSDLRYAPSTNPVRYFSTLCSPRSRNGKSEWYLSLLPAGGIAQVPHATVRARLCIRWMTLAAAGMRDIHGLDHSRPRFGSFPPTVWIVPAHGLDCSRRRDDADVSVPRCYGEVYAQPWREPFYAFLLVCRSFPFGRMVFLTVTTTGGGRLAYPLPLFPSDPF
jgi:hypothetical protein